MPLSITLTSDTKAGTYNVTAIDGTMTLTLDTSFPVSPPPPPSTSGTHAVSVIAVIGGIAYSSSATVGEDPQIAGQYLVLADAAGNKHPGLRAIVYADCCDVGAVNGRSGNDYAGTLRVEYDGIAVFATQAVQFYRGCLNQTIRYGSHQPAWKNADASLFPNYAQSPAPLPLQDLAKFDWSYNGMGCASYVGMGTTGARKDIGFVPGWDVPFLVQPSDASYAVVRKASDQSGAWPIYFLDDDTGHPFDITKYPNTSFVPYIQSVFNGNPIVQYGTTPVWNISGSPCRWDEAHETGYNFVAAAATMSARDRFHASVWANAVLTALNPVYRQTNGVWAGYQERGTAWALRSLFLASYVSDMTSYFVARLDEQRVQGERQLTNPMGFMATYVTRTFPDGSKGTAPWEENYVRTVIGVTANKVPVWGTVAGRLRAWLTGILNSRYQQFATIYTMAIHDSTGNAYTTWDQVIKSSLTGTWSDANVAELLNPATTSERISELIVANKSTSWAGKLGDFDTGYPTSCEDYNSYVMAATATMVGNGPEWQFCITRPTQPTWTTGWFWNIVPEAA